jgi:protein SCO1/2
LKNFRLPNWRLQLATASLAAVLLWLWFGWQPAPSVQSLESTGAEALPVGGDFVLEASTGKVSLSAFRGKLVFLYFGYTACPDVCPTNLALLAMALRELAPAERARVQVLFVSLDPERDSLAHLHTYARYFHESILGLTISEPKLREIASRYDVRYRRSADVASAMGYLIDHSANTYLIDDRGRVREVLGHATSAARIVATVRRYLADT